jgi:2,3-bisphosphoglycerate-independent phosphoglycerate mutase
VKHVIVILDGASGGPLPEFGNQTTLQLAKTPHLDALAQVGQVGLALTVPAGLEPSSNIACSSIVGYDPCEYPIGRGALELAALGVELADDEIALRANLCHISEQGVMLSYSCNNISSADGHALADELKAQLDDAECRLYKGSGFRLYLVVKGRPALMQTKLPMAHELTDLAVADHLASGPEAEFIANYSRRAAEVLAHSKVNASRAANGLMVANSLMCFWPGQRPSGMQPFAERYGYSAALNSGVDLLAGIASLTGIERYDFAGVTDGPDNDYRAQGLGALKMLRQHDVVFVHIEAPDAEGHDGNILGKRAAVEQIDHEIIRLLLDYAQSEPLRILALPDHPTPVLTKRHTADAVPFVLAGPGIGANAGLRLTELEAAKTGLIIDPGWHLMRHLLVK